MLYSWCEPTLQVYIVIEMSDSPQRVCVIGAGVIGLSTALRLLQTTSHVTVTVMADSYTPFTTGDGAAGWWEPYMLGDTPKEKIKKWAGQTFRHILEILKTSEAGEAGVILSPGYLLENYEGESSLEPFKDILLGYRPMTPAELDLYPAYKTGQAYFTTVSECKKYLPWMMKKITSLGGVFIKKKVAHFSELVGDFDVIVNCSGLGARTLANDDSVFPINGHIFRVKAPWIKTSVIADNPDVAILCCADSVVLGGTHIEGEWSRTPDPISREKIWNACTNVIPSLKTAEVIHEWIGLRPGRKEVRLESEIISTPRGNIKVVHNYGHGGAGVTLHWGCAIEAADKVQHMISTTQAKL